MKSFNTIIRLKSIESTNSYANSLLKKETLDEGTIIVTDEQIAGKGLGKNFWESEPGKNLTFSIILYPDFLHVERQFVLSKAISLGLYHYTKSKTNDIKIKWPNDIYYKNQKLAGVLIENSIKGTTLNSSIVGIGLNCNQTIFLSNAPNPVSLKQITGSESNLENELIEVKNYIEKYYIKLKSGKTDEIHGEYLECLYRYNEWHLYKKDNVTYKAKITGINEYGHLILTNEDGKENEFDLKEVSFVL